MLAMDHKPIDDLVTELEASDPADAPPVADAVAGRLAAELDDEDEDDRAESASPA